MTQSFRDPGTVTEVDDNSVTMRSTDNTVRRAMKGASFHCWLVDPRFAIGTKFTHAPEIGDIVRFVISSSIETVVTEPVKQSQVRRHARRSATALEGIR